MVILIQFKSWHILENKLTLEKVLIRYITPSKISKYCKYTKKLIKN